MSEPMVSRMTLRRERRLAESEVEMVLQPAKEK